MQPIKFEVVMETVVDGKRRIYVRSNCRFTPEGLILANRCGTEVYPFDGIEANDLPDSRADYFFVLDGDAARPRLQALVHTLATRLHEEFSSLSDHRQSVMIHDVTAVPVPVEEACIEEREPHMAMPATTRARDPKGRFVQQPRILQMR